jgi:3'(2'), 5'-bisphosphate nucleotidase
MLDDDRLLDLFERLSLEAGRAIMEVRARGPEAEIKRDLSPVTEADRAAEKIILSGLRASLPEMSCVAEEEVAAGALCKTDGGAFILVDPLDGTREYLDGKPDFTVNIALVRDGVPVVGTVFAPARGELYSGRPGRAEFAEVGADFSVSARRPIAVRNAPARPLVLASRSHRTPPTDAFIATLKDVECRAIGSSLKFGLLARGEADLYPRFGPTMEWDTAAGDAVLRAAGGRTLTLDGTPLIYGGRKGKDGADFANPWLVACGADCRGLEAALAACRERTD